MRSGFSSLLIILLLLWLPSPGHALEPDQPFQNYVRDTWSSQHGLPQVSAIGIAQDRDGYIWIGTQAGLARFDGVRFVTFTPQSEPNLPGAWISTLYQAVGAKLWIGTYNGAVTYDGSRFIRVPAAAAALWPALEIHSFAQDRLGQMWVGTTNGLFKEGSGQLHSVAGSPLLAQSLLALGDDLFVGSRGAVYHLARGEWHPESLPKGNETTIVNHLVAAQGQLWAATTKGLFTLGPKGWTVFPAASAWRQTALDLLFADRQGNLWVGGDVGLARIRDRRITEFTAASDPAGIPGLRSGFEDRENNLWLGSQTEGVTRLHDSWTRRFTLPGGLGNALVWSLAADTDKRGIWVGGNGGVSLFENGKFKTVVRSDALPQSDAYTLLAEPDRLWIGTRRGLAVVDLSGSKAGQLQQPALFAPLLNAQINGLVRSNGDLWIPSSEGLFCLHNGTLRSYGKADGLTDPRARFFYRLRDGHVLLGTQGGLYEMYGEHFSAVGLGKGLPPGIGVSAITQLSDGRIVIGTFAQQMYFADKGRWRLLAPAQGMPVNTPFFLVEHRGYLWSAGDNGISRVPIGDLTAFASGRLDHVRGESLLNEGGELSGREDFCCNGAGNGKGLLLGDALWLPTRNGIVALDTQSIIENAVRPTAVIERVQAGLQWTLAKTARGNAFSKDTRDLTFEFTVLSFQEPKNVGLQYRLVGYDSAWHHANPMERYKRYINLPTGRYQFEVRGTNNAGLSTAAPDKLSFSIEPQFHETWAFKALLMLLLVALVLAAYEFKAYRIRVNWLHEREAVLEERERIAGEIHDSLTQGLSGIVFQTEAALLSIARAPEMTRSHLTSARDLAKSSLVDARYAIWDISPPGLAATGLLESLSIMADQLTSGRIDELDVSADGAAWPLRPEANHHVLLIAQEAVSNALQHGKARNISISITYATKNVRIVVSDNGIGFEGSPGQSERRGYGLPNMRHRAKSLGAKLNVASEVGKGTHVFLDIPKRTWFAGLWDRKRRSFHAKTFG